MLNLDVISIYILTIALMALVFGVFINNKQKNGQAVSIWLASTILGLLLGASGALGVCYLLNYEVVERLDLSGSEAGSPGDADLAGQMTPGGGSPGGGSPGGDRTSRGGGGSPDGGSPAGGGSRGGSRQIPARFQLAMLVRKLDLLTGDIAIHLSDEQAREAHALLIEIEAAETLSDDDAQVKYDALLALMEDSQKVKTEAVSLPFRRGGSGSRGGGGSRGGAGSEGAGDANLFREGSSAEAIQALLGRLAGNEATDEK